MGSTKAYLRNTVWVKDPCRTVRGIQGSVRRLMMLRHAPAKSGITRNTSGKITINL